MATFIDYCRKGDIEGIKQILADLTRRETERDDHISLKDCDMEEGFRVACFYGHYNIIRYLTEIYINDSTYSPINIHAFDGQGLKLAFYFGHYDIVRYLVEMYKNDSNYQSININRINNYGFIVACENGHYNIARYLMELHKNDSTYKPIDVYDYCEYNFIQACLNGHYIIANYLLRTTKNNKCDYSKQFNNYHMVFKKFEKYLL